MFNTQQQTKDEIKEMKKARVEMARDYHQALIRNLGISRTDFNVKSMFYSKDGVQVVGLFASELLKPKGFYFELTDRELNPVDPNRTVYRVPYNPAYNEEYEMTEKGSYLVPLQELRPVDPQTVAINGISALIEEVPEKAKPKFEEPTQTNDAPYSEMTIRDYYAIHTGKPVSTKEWLNQLITKNK